MYSREACRQIPAQQPLLSIVPSLMISLVNGLRCSPTLCETRARVEALSSCSCIRRYLAQLQHMLRTSLALIHSSSASQSSSSTALYSAVISRLISPSLNSVFAYDVNCYQLHQFCSCVLAYNRAEFCLVLCIIAHVILHCILKHKFRSSASLQSCTIAAPAFE